MNSALQWLVKIAAVTVATFVAVAGSVLLVAVVLWILVQAGVLS